MIEMIAHCTRPAITDTRETHYCLILSRLRGEQRHRRNLEPARTQRPLLVLLTVNNICQRYVFCDFILRHTFVANKNSAPNINLESLLPSLSSLTEEPQCVFCVESRRLHTSWCCLFGCTLISCTRVCTA
ncbi:hypothetical protein M378DRAFT_810132 [Amanita muscaria Koide BX008]|uniref:Uncharacterized protein n=1 Tax=Amanita muscaria (strain Koide BX008) TaxID=946122 RepID=A0A0C2T5X2_AMAMK|nr:hypothetical protein M378DRAFT_810132 [Amanita muscaria Koide BX008]